jgi:hypothetical protein
MAIPYLTIGFKMCAVEVGSGAKIYIPSFIKIDSGIQKLMGDIHKRTQHEGRIGLLSFFFVKIRNVG